ncbi:uncharacterized protein Hap1MRO34_025313 [Clarias gariepinus]
MIHFFPTLTYSPTTEEPTAGSLLSVLSVTGVCVLLVGLVIVCLCIRIRKKKPARCKLNRSHCDQGVMMSMSDKNNSGSEAAETSENSMISSVHSLSQPLGQCYLRALLHL